MSDQIEYEDRDVTIAGHDFTINGEDYTEENLTPEQRRYQRVPADSPLRCQANNSQGQCNMRKVDGSEYCYIHGGHGAERKNERSGMLNYQLSVYHRRAAELACSSGLKNLRDEVGIMRMILERKLNEITNENDLILASPEITNMILTISKVVESCHKIDKDLNNLMDKSELIAFAESLSALLEGEITDKTILQGMIPKLQLLVNKHLLGDNPTVQE